MSHSVKAQREGSGLRGPFFLLTVFSLGLIKGIEEVKEIVCGSTTEDLESKDNRSTAAGKII